MNQRIAQTIARHLADLSADAAADRPDAELLGRFVADRDGAAFAALVRRHGPMVWAACRHLLPNPADAEDAFQATFLALAKSAHRVQSAAAVGGWLHGVAVRAALKVRRSETQRKRWERAAAGPEAGRPVPDSAWDGLLAAVHEEVGRLPDALRTAFVLCDLEGVPQPAAAARLGWKPGTLTGRLARARQRLLDQLTKRGLAPAVAATGIGTATTGAAVPPGLNQTVLAWVADPAGVPAAVSVLVAEVTAMTISKMKLLAAGLMVAGGLGLGVEAGRVATVTAQVPADAPRPVVKVGPFVDPLPPSPPQIALPSVEPGASASEYKMVLVASHEDRRNYDSTWSALIPIAKSQYEKLLAEHGRDGWVLVGQEVLHDGYKETGKATPMQVGRQDLQTAQYMVFRRAVKALPPVAAALEARWAASPEVLAAMLFRQLGQWSGDPASLRFDAIPQVVRDRWAEFVKAGIYPPLPTTGAMDEAQFTKWFLDDTKARREQRLRDNLAPPPAAKTVHPNPSIQPSAITVEEDLKLARAQHKSAAERLAKYKETVTIMEELHKNARTTILEILPVQAEVLKWELQVEEAAIRVEAAERRAAAGAKSAPAANSLTADEDLKLARVQQKVAAARLEKYKQSSAITEAQYKKGVASFHELLSTQSEVLKLELEAEEAAIRLEAAERRAAEAGKPTPAPKTPAAEPKR